jgi:transcription-repair coupling factor (superfamily II helicase)
MIGLIFLKMINKLANEIHQNAFYLMEKGKIDIIIGTHRLLGKDVKFSDLGLMIIDEEQKFGVAAKEKLKAIRVNVDTLTLTATPIPRTLQFSLMHLLVNFTLQFTLLFFVKNNR